MKKILGILLAALLAVPAFSQESADLTLLSSEDGRFSLDVFSHFGWGYGFVKSDDFTPKGSGEVFVNVLKLKVFPVQSLGFELGADLGWRYVGSKESAFIQRDHVVHAVDFSTIFRADHSRSTVSTFSINVPLLLKFKAGDCSIGAGAEAQFNLTGETSYYYRDEDTRVDATTSKAKVNTFTYGFVGTIGYNDFSVFAKFYPKNVRFLPEGSVDFNLWTLGVAYGF